MLCIYDFRWLHQKIELFLWTRVEINWMTCTVFGVYNYNPCTRLPCNSLIAVGDENLVPWHFTISIGGRTKTLINSHGKRSKEKPIGRVISRYVCRRCRYRCVRLKVWLCISSSILLYVLMSLLLLLLLLLRNVVISNKHSLCLMEHTIAHT